jgi:hypothetical protein
MLGTHGMQPHARSAFCWLFLALILLANVHELGRFLMWLSIGLRVTVRDISLISTFRNPADAAHQDCTSKYSRNYFGSEACRGREHFARGEECLLPLFAASERACRCCCKRGQVEILWDPSLSFSRALTSDWDMLSQQPPPRPQEAVAAFDAQPSAAVSASAAAGVIPAAAAAASRPQQHPVPRPTPIRSSRRSSTCREQQQAGAGPAVRSAPLQQGWRRCAMAMCEIGKHVCSSLWRFCCCAQAFRYDAGESAARPLLDGCA